MSLIRQIGEWIKSLLHKMPQELEHAATQSLSLMLKISDWLKSDKAIALADLIAHEQTERLVIIGIMETLEAALSAAISEDDRQAIMAKRGALITKVIHGGSLPQNVYDSAFQVKYSDTKIS